LPAREAGQHSFSSIPGCLSVHGVAGKTQCLVSHDNCSGRCSMRPLAPLRPSSAFPPIFPRPKGRTVVIGAGKASAAMAKAVEELWPGPLTGLVVTRYGHAVP